MRMLQQKIAFGAAAALLAMQVAALAAMGVPWTCTCGHVALWAGSKAESSQQIADWYSLSHMLHGILFYASVHWFWPTLPVRWKILAVIGVEIAWELFENMPWVVERYRTATAATHYTGDSIVNSVSDVGFMLAGVVLVMKLPVRWVFGFAILAELVALAVMRDNLTLQIVTFIWPIDALVDWQSHA